ncbi:MAG: HEAT repeat domain-containing protein [Candidatus Omnitrophica bacterium]|nr:HEAT repeat domain-containing protein [Candidatus Omnitrophota bacterium]
MCKSRKTTIIFLICLGALTMLLSSITEAALSSQELRNFNKKLTAKDLPAIYAVTKEINERGEKHQLLTSGLRLYLNDDRIPFRCYIAETLFKIGDPYGLEYLKSVITNDASTDIEKITALNALGNTRSPEAISIVQPYLESQESHITLAALRSLLKCGMAFDANEMAVIFGQCTSANKVLLLHDLVEYKEKYIPVFSLALEETHSSVAYTAFKYLVKLEDFGGLDTIYSKLSTIKQNITRLEAELLLAEKNVINEVSFTKEYMSVNTYGRLLLLDLLRDCRERYPETIHAVLSSLLQIEDDDFLRQRIIGLQEQSEEEGISEK